MTRPAAVARRTMSTCSSMAIDLAQDRIERVLERAVDRIALRGPQLVEVGVDPLARLAAPSGRRRPEIARHFVAREHGLGDVVEHRAPTIPSYAVSRSGARSRLTIGIGELPSVVAVPRGRASALRPAASTLGRAPARMRRRRVALADVSQHHQRRQQQRRGIGDALVGDVGRAAVHGLEHRRRSSPRLAPGTTPSPPTRPAHRSETMSP